MATAKQTEANRKNAQNSTGPRTVEGKAITAQNALKHGLTAQKPLIPGEDPAEFELHCQLMRDELDPQTPLENILANRITTLAWQLNRGPGIHAAVFNRLIADLFDPPQDPELRLGRAVAKDFYNSCVLDRIQTYTARIETNLYKTIQQLQRIQQIRQNTPCKNKPNPSPHWHCEERSDKAISTPTKPKTEISQNKPNPTPKPKENEKTNPITRPKYFQTPYDPMKHLRPARIHRPQHHG